jgi:hypothetical protein
MTMKAVNVDSLEALLAVAMVEVEESMKKGYGATCGEAISSIKAIIDMLRECRTIEEYMYDKVKKFSQRDDLLNILKQYRATLVVERAAGEIAAEKIKTINQLMEVIRE